MGSNRSKRNTKNQEFFSRIEKLKVGEKVGCGMCTCPHPKKCSPWHRQTFQVPQWPLTLPASISDYSDVQWSMMYVHLLAHDYMLWQDYTVLLSSHYATPQSIIPNTPLSPAVPLLLCWMLRTALALSKCYLELDSYSPFHAIYDGPCCVVVNSGVMSGTLHKRTSSSNFTWCGHREGHQLCLLAAKPHIL